MVQIYIYLKQEYSVLPEINESRVIPRKKKIPSSSFVVIDAGSGYPPPLEIYVSVFSESFFF